MLDADRLSTSVLADTIGDSPATGEGGAMEVRGRIPPLQRITSLQVNEPGIV